MDDEEPPEGRDWRALILGCLHDIVKRLVDRDGVLFSPKKGIPLGGTLSPFWRVI